MKPYLRRQRGIESWPASADADRPGDVNPGKTSAAPPASGRILVADFDPVLRGRLARALAGAGHSVDEADSRPEMLDLLASSLAQETTPYDVIVCSASLPGWSGLNLLYAVDLYRRAPRMVLLHDPLADDLLADAYHVRPAVMLNRQVDGAYLLHIVAELLAVD
jgi:CheY-like chemotaxis protein